MDAVPDYRFRALPFNVPIIAAIAYARQLSVVTRN